MYTIIYKSLLYVPALQDKVFTFLKIQNVTQFHTFLAFMLTALIYI